MARGKSINLFLIDGDATGLVKCTLANWTGVAYRIPRTELDKCKERKELKQSGVYFLLCKSNDNDQGSVIYVGQAGARKNGEGILNRLAEHKKNADKDYWNEAIVFTTSNNSFGPTEISYLEKRFYNLALEAKRYEVKNGNDPAGGNVTEEKESELEEFIDNAKIIVGTLGHQAFKPFTENNTSNLQETINQAEKLFYLKRKSKKSGKVIEATCKQTNEGFVVLKGSHIETIDSEAIPTGVKTARANAKREGKIDAQNVLQEDMLFNSPSYAAAFVIGMHSNGLKDWKTQEGKTLKSIEEAGL